MKLHATISFSSQGIAVCIKDEPNTPSLRDGFTLTVFATQHPLSERWTHPALTMFAAWQVHISH